MHEQNMGTPVLEIRGLEVRRGATTVLAGVDWRVERGEHWVIMGPNGGGKTSLLRAIFGYLTSSSGCIRVMGLEQGREDWRDVRRRLGLVSSALQGAVPEEEIALATVASGVGGRLGLWGDPTRAEVQQARALLRKVGGRGLENKPWGVLSQGERQRVLLARALAGKPSLLVLDEPCAGLDPVAREGFLRDLQGLMVNGPTVVLVTHHVEEITPAFSHLMLMGEGRVSAAGPVARVLTSAALSGVFGADVRVRATARRWRLEGAAR